MMINIALKAVRKCLHE